MTLNDMKQAVSAMKAAEVGTIYVQGERQYAWSLARGWVNPGPLKAALRAQPVKRG